MLDIEKLRNKLTEVTTELKDKLIDDAYYMHSITGSVSLGGDWKIDLDEDLSWKINNFDEYQLEDDLKGRELDKFTLIEVTWDEEEKEWKEVE